MKIMKYGERLKAARKFAGITQADLVKEIGNIITQAGVSFLENGDSTGSEYTVQFAIKCGVRPEWLASESGEMLNSSKKYDKKIEAVMLLMEDMPEYKKDILVSTSTALAEHLKQNGAQ